MSIITDNRGTSYRIARFGNIATVNNVTYKAKQYVRISKGYFEMKHAGNVSETSWRYQYGSSSNDSVLIKCEIPSTVTNAYFYGFYTNANAQMWIGKVDNKIRWAMGQTTREVDYQPGVHVYGFDSAGYAVYDGTRVGNSMREGGYSGSRDNIVIGARRDGDEFSYATVDIYEVVLLAYRRSSSLYRDEAHLYAASGDDTNPVLFETRKDSAIYGVKSFTKANDGSGSVGPDVTYGIQLHDLKYMTKSGYHDLVALVCEDWPEQAKTGSDTVYTLTKTADSSTFKSAFLLKDNNFNMPIPSGWTHEGTVSRPNTDGLMGALISGRTPKWHLWADNMNVGKYAAEVNNVWEYKYNILKPRGYSREAVELAAFENYEHSTTANNPPFFDLGNAITIEYHNGIAYKCAASNKVGLYCDSTITKTESDDMRVFTKEQSTMASEAHMALGNLVDWHKTAAQQKSDSSSTAKYYMFFGISGTIKRNYGNGATRIVAAVWQQTAASGSSVSLGLLPLSSDTPAAEITKFKTGKVNDAWYDWGAGDKMSVCGTERDQDQIYYEISQTTGNTIVGEGQLDIIMQSTAITSASVPASALCNTLNIMPATKVNISGNMNPYTSESTATPTNYRCILMNSTTVIGGTARKILPLFAGQDKLATGSTNYYGCATRVQDTSADNPVFQMIVCCLSSSTNDSGLPVSLSGGLHLSAEFVTINNGMTRTLIEKDFTLGASQLVGNEGGARGNIYFRHNTNSGGTVLINDDNRPESSYCASVRFLKNELSAHCYNYTDTFESGWRLRRDTTVRVWVEAAAQIIPKVKIHASQYNQSEGTYDFNYYNYQYARVRKSDLFNLPSKDSAVNIFMECWNTNTHIYEEFNVDTITTAYGSNSNYGMVVEVFRTWGVSGSSPSGERICAFIIFKSSISGSISGLIAYGADRGNAWQYPYSETASGPHHTYSLSITGGMINPMLVITDLLTGTAKGWGSNNLTVKISRMQAYDFYE